MRIAEIHERLAAEGYAVESVRKTRAGLEVDLAEGNQATRTAATARAAELAQLEASPNYQEALGVLALHAIGVDVGATRALKARQIVTREVKRLRDERLAGR